MNEQQQMEEQHRKVVALERLFRTYPSFGKGETAEEVARDRMAKAEVYLAAVEPYQAADVESAVSAFITGTVPGHNPAFAPTAPEVGSATRREMEHRVGSEVRARKPALPPPDIEHSEESRARIKALVAGCVASLTSITAAEDEARELEKAERWQRTHVAFVPDLDEAAMAARLGFTVGDRDGDEDAA